MLYRIKFIQDVITRRAHQDGKRGGYRQETIRAGTELVVKPSSYNYWTAKGVVELIGKEEVPSVFSLPADTVEHKGVTKTELRDIVSSARNKLEGAFPHTASEDLRKIEIDETVEDYLKELDDDVVMLFKAAIADAATRGEISVNAGELNEALLDVEDVLLPPSRRKRIK